MEAKTVIGIDYGNGKDEDAFAKVRFNSDGTVTILDAGICRHEHCYQFGEFAWKCLRCEQEVK